MLNWLQVVLCSSLSWSQLWFSLCDLFSVWLTRRRALVAAASVLAVFVALILSVPKCRRVVRQDKTHRCFFLWSSSGRNFPLFVTLTLQGALWRILVIAQHICLQKKKKKDGEMCAGHRIDGDGKERKINQFSAWKWWRIFLTLSHLFSALLMKTIDFQMLVEAERIKLQ